MFSQIVDDEQHSRDIVGDFGQQFAVRANPGSQLRVPNCRGMPERAAGRPNYQFAGESMHTLSSQFLAESPTEPVTLRIRIPFATPNRNGR
jgi:hypothetical protein